MEQFKFLENLEQYKGLKLCNDDMNKVQEEGYSCLLFKVHPLTFIDVSGKIPEVRGFRNIFIGDLGNNISKWAKRLYSNKTGLDFFPKLIKNY